MKTIKRRRKENKTDYAARIGLLKSGKPRLIFRKTNKHVIVQYVKSKEAQDRVDLGISSKNLLNYGWPKELKNSLKSLPAAYLTGFLMGNKIKKENLEEPIIDFGMIRTIHKSKIYSFLKGLIDSGVRINVNEKIFPSQERMEGKHLKEDFTKNFEKIKSEITKNA